jgi:predicted RNA binding protein YcfA (HicA-like mRNA interferase family)
MEPLKQKRIRRLLDRVAANPKNCNFEDLARLLEAAGFNHRHGKGSHHYFKRGRYPLSVPYGRPVKECYVHEALELVKLVTSEKSQ